MKLIKKRIAVSALALATGVCLAGSVTGTIAWYQYSTRASAIYNYTSAGGTRGSLQISIDDSDIWYTTLTHNDIGTYLNSTHSGDQLIPITSGPMSKTSPLPEFFHKDPLPKHASYSEWKKADNHNYISLPLKLRYVDHMEGDSVVCSKQQVYLTKLSITNDSESLDITESIRFHITSFNKNDKDNTTINRLISKNGGKILTHGSLDLDGDGNDDVIRPDGRYDFNGGDPQIVDYGEGEQESFVASADADEANEHFPILAEFNDETSSLEKLFYNGSESKSIGITGLEKEDVLNVIITIWIEGWQNLSSSSIWDSDTVGANFNIDFEFTANEIL